MTLRTIESEFSRRLQEQSPIHDENLSLDAPLFTKTLPKVLWFELQNEFNPGQELTDLTVRDWEIEIFSSLEEAKKHHPEVSVARGTPSQIAAMRGSGGRFILDFSPLGVALLEKKLHHVQYLKASSLAYWLVYALSEELWGPVGKWQRFHDRLLPLLEKRNLLRNESLPGRYELIKEGKRLETHGFKGTTLDHSYLIVLPWTFPLTALERLEKAIQQEFPCTF
jgi:hypothetical protein